MRKYIEKLSEKTHTKPTVVLISKEEGEERKFRVVAETILEMFQVKNLFLKGEY